jgi:hypothetical protein
MSPDDRNRFDRDFEDRNADRGFSDRNLSDRGFSDRNADRGLDRGADDRNLAAAAAGGLSAADRGLDREFSDRNLSASDREFSDRNLSTDDRGFGDRDFEDRQLEDWLTDSGQRARAAASPPRPSPLYAADLRERLVARLETQRPPLFPFWIGQRIARVVPVSVAALLFAVAVVGAAQLDIGGPDPSESPVAHTDEASPSFVVDPSLEPIETVLPAPIVPVATPSPDAAPTTHQPPPPPPSTPAPTPPGPVAMTLSLKSCEGGVVIGWSKYKSGGFNHYTTLRNDVNNVPMAYPPQGGAIDFGGTYTTDHTVLSAVDAKGDTGVQYWYRTMAFNAADQVIGATGVGSAMILPTASLGSVGVAPDAGGTLISWTPYGGNGACFTWYKVLASTTNPNPSYLTGDPYVYAGSSQGESSTVVSDLVSGETYFIRVQAIKATALGLFVAGQTDVATYTVP